MRGEILFYDERRGSGFITGDDGNRYTFLKSDLKQRGRLEKGLRVDFRTEGDRARDMFLAADAPSGQAEAPRPAAAPPRIPRNAEAAEPATSSDAVAPEPAVPPRASASPPAGDLGLLGYFRHCVTTDYVNFRGRARRKEYWAFVLFALIITVALGAVGLVVDGALGNLDTEEPFVSGILFGLVTLALLLPGLGVLVRRLHDIGLSGWFVLLSFVPYVGSLIILVFALIPSKQASNKWGPVPAGA